MDVTIYHNPSCSKSRETLALLREQGFEPTVIEYLKTPPSAAELDAILTKLGLEPREAMRKGEDEYKALGLGDPNLTRGELVAAMAANPRLIERPIVVRGERAALGRPPENVLKLLGE
jgi:arsenate reductase